MFCGYYMPAATMINDEDQPAAPELARRITACSSARDPAAALVPSWKPWPRTASPWATSWPTPASPTAGKTPGPGRCATSAPKPLLELAALPPGASAADVAAHDQQTSELARHKFGLHAAEDADGYRRLSCPAVTGKVRCPLRPASMKLERSRPEILAPPGHPRACGAHKTITAGPDAAATVPVD
jgi:hypothetical protein